ncbi:MAG TPA: GNAT family N-acetyltransferase [Ferrovibrio sp.]|jgi:GNAT superfamily N-acetyltransferase|uniref:GNAT family N-acetyltransferase n=1 Tax=Ferrovibrio sp. TaxID=1917215 RepID=UPI002B4B065F|nr:GNAT family N-acetyltransferase [Ferrovibrio sp.]HLT77756.1 GNAT family N-acetyltransferase [Ferrovibrio sp.]
MSRPSSALRVVRFSGDEMRARLDDLARLRIEVFRAFPYLYEGSLDYERKYLTRYANARTGTIAVALDGDQVVGACTALALEEEADFVQAPFLEAGMDIGEIFYFGESVLLPQYRGQGIGVRFFEEREAAAREFGYPVCCFCAVARPEDHPLKPEDYVPLDNFWRNRGYEKRPELVSQFGWTDIGEQDETAKPMIYWMKRLA